VEIIGHGFLAKNLSTLSSSHPDVIALAAGVSVTRGATEAEYQREASLVYDTIHRCLESGRRLLFFSTASPGIYGPSVSPAREDGPVFPATPYGRHKLAMENVVRLSGVRHLILRMSNSVGPHQAPHQLLPALTAQIREGLVRVHRGATRDLIDIADVLTILDDLLERQVDAEVVNVASGVSTPVLAIVEELALATGQSPRLEFVDAPAGSAVSVDKLRRLAPCVERLGFGPDYYRGVIRRHAMTSIPA
jgi:NDP-hexose 4-ketoreductase